MEVVVNAERTYSGIINQEEFKRRWALIKARILSGYSQEDLAFLLGKPPYFIRDYEDLNASSKLALEDLEILSVVLKNLYPEILPFDRDETGENEKRLVRGAAREIAGICYYTFTHPWTIDGKNIKIVTEEKVLCVGVNTLMEINNNIYESLLNLIAEGCFNNWCRPLELFQLVNKQLNTRKASIRPSYLIPAIYKLIAEKKLKMTSDRFRFCYKVQDEE